MREGGASAVPPMFGLPERAEPYIRLRRSIASQHLICSLAKSSSSFADPLDGAR
jgi:hypothetical protein